MISVSFLHSRRGRWAVCVAALVIVVGGTLIWSLRSASAGPPPPDLVDFSTLHAHRPVAGQMFEGLAIINQTQWNGTAHRFSAVRCDAAIGSNRLPARKFVYGVPQYGQVIVCGWRIPADAAGKTLGFWNNRGFGKRFRGPVVTIGPANCGTRAHPCKGSPNGVYGGPQLTWHVMKP